MPLNVGSLARPTDVQTAVDEVLSGGFVATQYHGVFIIIFSATDTKARQGVLAAKGETESSKPLSSLTFCKHIFPYVDVDRIPALAMRDMIVDVERYRRALGAICHVRVPLTREATQGPIPSQILSVQDGVPYVQSLDPYGNLLFSNLAHELNAVGIPFIAASSLNRSGESEICELSAAKTFCGEAGIPYLLRDPLFVAPDVKGSFPIIDLEKMTAVRDGHIPVQIVERIVGLEFDKNGMSPAQHSHSPHLRSLLERQELQGSALRRSVLNHLYGAAQFG